MWFCLFLDSKLFNDSEYPALPQIQVIESDFLNMKILTYLKNNTNLKWWDNEFSIEEKSCRRLIQGCYDMESKIHAEATQGNSNGITHSENCR